MKKMIIILSVPFVLIFQQCKQVEKNEDKKTVDTNIPAATINKTIKELKAKFPHQDEQLISKGVAQTAALWLQQDGTPDDFIKFCLNNYAENDSAKKELFDKISYYIETLYGNLNKLNIELKSVLHIDKGTIAPIDELFGGYDPFAHINDDFFNNRIAHVVILNFPFFTLKEKNELGVNWNSLQWAYARLGDVFTSRVPASLLLKSSEIITEAENYIANYNIYMGNIIDSNGNKLFPENLRLISHWGLRDELKADYNDENALKKQRMIYQIMNRIITQEIPQEVINNNKYNWNPLNNKTFDNGKEINLKYEPDTRYEILLKVFNSIKSMDKYYPAYTNYIERKFEQEIEIPVDEVEKIFIDFISSKEVKQVAELISQRLGRPLEPFDIWYDGFKTRSSVNQTELDKIVNKKYPDKACFERDLPVLLTKLGFEKEQAKFITSRIIVDPARGSGHAWGSLMRSEKSRLRTRIGQNGMDYKGYNIAIHEFGHNVEQTISLNYVDYYMMNGVPNTAFTEALAFIFQKRDLQLLGIKDNNINKKNYQALDVFWDAYEIMGVALVDINTWKWMYKHPDAKAVELKNAVLNIAKDIWNKYYAEVFGIKDQNILAIYSHMIDSPLYLSNYPLGHIIDFQLENYINNKNFASEILRIYSQGRLTPKLWMQKAVGSDLSVNPVIQSVDKALMEIKK